MLRVLYNVLTTAWVVTWHLQREVRRERVVRSVPVFMSCPTLEAVCLTLLGAVGETEKAPQLINIMQCQATG